MYPRYLVPPATLNNFAQVLSVSTPEPNDCVASSAEITLNYLDADAGGGVGDPVQGGPARGRIARPAVFSLFEILEVDGECTFKLTRNRSVDTRSARV